MAEKIKDPEIIPRSGPPERFLWNDLSVLQRQNERIIALLERIAQIKPQVVNEIFAAQPIQIPGEIFTLVRNLDKLAHGQHLVEKSGRPEQLESIFVTPGRPFLIIAKPENSGKIYIGGDSAATQDNRRKITMLSGSAMSFHLSNLSCLWIDAENNGEGIVWLFEV
jgi:hypothetical protein